MDLEGTTAIVTGGARRLGRAIALALGRAGANVVVNYRRSAKAAEATVRDLRDCGARALAVQADVADPRQVDRLVRQTRQAFSTIDLLVANAGTFRRTPFAEVTERNWDDAWRGNFQAMAVPARRIGKLMCEGRRGCIIAVADVAGIRPWADYIPYSVAKTCVIAYTLELAAALAPHVRANAIAPGPILFPDDFDPAAQQREIDRTALKRQGKPAHIADAVIFLARNSYITGAVLPVDGGRLLTRRA